MATRDALQSRLAAALAGDHVPRAVDALLPELADGGAIGAAAGVAIYRNNTKAVRIRALEQVFPVCQAILGQACFRALARDYLDAQPSGHPDLNHYGGRFFSWLARFLDTQGRQAFVGMDYLPDLARFEYGYHRLHYSADDGRFDVQAFQRRAETYPDRLVLEPSKGLRLFRSAWPIYKLWRGHRLGAPLPRLCTDPDHLVLCRRGYEVRVQILSEAHWELLSQAFRGASLSELSEHPAASELGHFLRRGWIVGSRLR